MRMRCDVMRGPCDMMDMTDDGCDGDLYLLGRDEREREKTRRAVRRRPCCMRMPASINSILRTEHGGRQETHTPPPLAHDRCSEGLTANWCQRMMCRCRAW